MGADRYFEWRDGGCTEEVNRLNAENKKLREQLVGAVKQGIDGASAGYQELLRRQRQAVYGLLMNLERIIEEPTPQNFDYAKRSVEEIREMLGIPKGSEITLITGE